MQRRRIPRNKAANQVSLFPFLSVLVCAKGALIVVFCVVSLCSLESTQQTFVVTVRNARVRRTGEAQVREPIYVLCDASGLTVHLSPANTQRLAVSKLNGPGGGAIFNQLARDLGRLSRERWPVLFVKPSGIKHARALQKALKARNVRMGKWAFGERDIWESHRIP